jgi:hypothetical protein
MYFNSYALINYLYMFYIFTFINKKHHFIKQISTFYQKTRVDIKVKLIFLKLLIPMFEKTSCLVIKKSLFY